jgi:hypothetical protein
MHLFYRIFTHLGCDLFAAPILSNLFAPLLRSFCCTYSIESFCTSTASFLLHLFYRIFTHLSCDLLAAPPLSWIFTHLSRDLYAPLLSNLFAPLLRSFAPPQTVLDLFAPQPRSFYRTSLRVYSYCRRTTCSDDALRCCSLYFSALRYQP